MSKINGVDETIKAQIIDAILSHKPVEKIVVFGSRATDDFDQVSDIDIAIWGRDWSDTDLNLVKHTLENSIKTPLKFDLVNFYSTKKEHLRENIVKNGKVIYESGAD